jgi:hypothetical protein
MSAGPPPSFIHRYVRKTRLFGHHRAKSSSKKLAIRGSCFQNVLLLPYSRCSYSNHSLVDASKFINQSQSRISQHLRGNSNDASDAPLFYSATDNLADEDDHNRERDALKASRRNFGAFFGLGLQDEGDEEDESFISDEEQRPPDAAGLAASWKPTPSFRSKTLRKDVIPESMEESELSKSADSDRTTRPIRNDGVSQQDASGEVGHYFFNPEESRMSASQPPPDLHIEVPLNDDGADSEHEDKSQPPLWEAPPAPIYQGQGPGESFRSYSPRQPPQDGTLPRPVSAPPLAAASYDNTWAAFYGLSMAGMFATSFMIWLGTEIPTDGLPFEDTIYSTLRSAFPLLVSDGILAIGISMLWLILMNHALQPFIYLLLFTVPIFMFTLFLVPLVQSFGGRWDGDTIQDRAMRWGSIVPALVGLWWTYKMWRQRQSLTRAVSIIALAGKIVRENHALVGFSFSVLAGFIAFTFIWVLMFSRVFLRNYKVEGGTFAKSTFLANCRAICYSRFLMVVSRLLYIYVSLDLGRILWCPKVSFVSFEFSNS